MQHNTTGAFILSLAAITASAQAQMIVNLDLGSLITGSYNLTGTTAGAGDEATYYDVVTNSIGNWGNDYVYQFSIADALIYQLDTNSLTGDPDFFLLNSLATDDSGFKNFATGAIQADFLDGTPPDLGTAAVLAPGTYYVSVDSWIGVDGSVVAQDATWNVTLGLTAVIPPVGAIPLGNLADAGQSFSIDTFGSGSDTELGLFDAAGFIPSACGGLDCNNDDAGGQQSELLIDGLATGTYFLALGTFNTSYGDGFAANSSGPGGDYVLNYPGGSRSGIVGDDDVNWFSFTVGVPEPASLLSLLLGLTAFSRMRRPASRAKPVICDDGKSEFALVGQRHIREGKQP